MSVTEATAVCGTSARVTITNRQLHELVKPVVPMASTDYCLPILNGVRLVVQGDQLVAAATDRFRLGIKRVKPETIEGDEFAVTVQLNDLMKMLALFRPGRRSVVKQPRLTLTVDDDTLVAEAIPGTSAEELHDLPTIKIGCKLVDGEYPSGVFTVAATALAQTSTQAEPEFACNAVFLGAFQAAIDWSEDPRGALLMRLGADPSKPAVFQAGDDFIGVLMPRRQHQPSAPSGWAETLEALGGRHLSAGQRRKAIGA